MKRIAWIAAAGVHLALVLCGALGYRPVSTEYLAGRVIETWRDFTGASTGFGFFAPGVASEWRATFEVCSGDARCLPVDEERVNAEARLLLVTIDALLAEPQLRDIIAASYAARQLARFPHADAVLVKASVFVVPPMEQYRRGRRPQWRNVHGFAFRRAAARARG